MKATDYSAAALAASMPANQWRKCPSCRELVYRKDWDNLLGVCPLCNYHQRLTSDERLAVTVDPGSFQETETALIGTDPLKFPGYAERLEKTRQQAGVNEAIRTGTARIAGYPVVFGVLDFHFRAGSMNAAVGEKVTRALELARELSQPAVMFVASGGARVDEGLHSLMQMAKTAAAIARLQAARQPLIVVLTDPSMAGVLASWASLGDVTIAEPGAVIGFTGPRVMEQTLKIVLPDGHQTAEFQLNCGMLDMVVDRIRMRETLVSLLRCLVGPQPPASEEGN